jgi:uncharacterized protein (DUF433 family)/predicted nuclease of predicted toxin-antitoxin system
VWLALQTKTEHPYVEINPAVCNGSPVITGTRIRIVDIAIEYEYLNCTPDEIINAHPHLKLEQVHDALSYYYENRAEFDQKIREDKQFIQQLRRKQKGRWTTISPKRIRIYADESVNVVIVESLKRRGVDVFSARDLGKLGLTDEEQLETAIQNKAVIFTHDADFIKIALSRTHLGIIYVHQQKMTIGECIKRLKTIAETTTPEEMQNNIIFL